MEAARIPWRPLGRLLVERGLLSEEELEHALDEQVTTGRRLGETHPRPCVYAQRASESRVPPQ